MLVNDRKEIRNESVSHQHFPLRMQIKHRCVVGEVSVSSNLSISGRGEVGFQSNSEALNTHNPNTQGGLKPLYVYVINKNGNPLMQVINPSVNVKKNCTRLTARTTTLIERRGTFLHGACPVVSCA